MSIDESFAAALDRVLEKRLRPIEAQLRRLDATDEILTVEQTAAVTGYSARTVRARAKAGTLPGFKPKGSSEWRFKRSAVMAALAPEESVDTESIARKIAGHRR